jgi:fibro-slime domain-containing protein
MQVTVRDFLQSHPDMQRNGWDGIDWGIVGPVLGADRKPIYMGGPDGTSSTSGEAAFYQWYHDSDASMRTTVSLPLTPMPGSDEFYQYWGRPFFPIDDQLLGNEQKPHNFYFTLEAHEDFIYQEGQVFTFKGDDDTWVFINNRLTIDLGGTHQTASATVKLTAQAEELGLVPGQTYPIDIFFAERHTLDSNFIIRTSITGLGQCPQ